MSPVNSTQLCTKSDSPWSQQSVLASPRSCCVPHLFTAHHHTGRNVWNLEGCLWCLYVVSWSSSCLLTQGLFIFTSFEESSGPWVTQIPAVHRLPHLTKPVQNCRIPVIKWVEYSDLFSAPVSCLSTNVVNLNVNRTVQWLSFTGHNMMTVCKWTFTLPFPGECSWMPEAMGNPLKQTESFLKICGVIHGNWVPRSRQPISNDSCVYQLQKKLESVFRNVSI